MMTCREAKRYDDLSAEAQFLRSENRWLRNDRDGYRREWYFTQERLNQVQERNQKLREENRRLKQQNKELTVALKTSPPQEHPRVSPRFKPSVRHRSKRPGRKAGHPPALRPLPDHIDVHQTVPLPKDPEGREACPWCKSCLLELKDQQRLVEDIVPAKVLVTAYHTRSGWCPSCRKRVESRALEQPPAANIPHGQIGLNALSTAMALRITHRLPFRQVQRIFLDLPNFSISSAAVADQVQRVAKWLSGDYEQLILKLRAAAVVHADETGWRTNGKNGWLWTMTSPTDTLYHVDKSRGGKVIAKLLGKAFGGTLVSDFYSAYSKIDCKKQKCLCHLLRELIESAAESPAFKTGPFFQRAKRLIKRMLLLKSRWDQLHETPLGATQYAARVGALENQLGRLVNVEYDEAHARRIARRMRKHQKELTAFLYEKDLDGTNNAAERALRPAVVARKISGGSRSSPGAQAWAKLASLLRSIGQRGQRLLETIKAMLTAAWASERPPSTLVDG
jgi:transposase